MAWPKMMFYLGCIVLLLAIVEATPPGIANHPAKASCKIKKYKMCYNLEHVCPKFCPDGCEVECASCKPICTSGSSPPTEGGADAGSSPPTYVSPPSDDDKGKGKGNDGKDKGDDDKGKGKGDDDKGKGKGDGDSPPYPHVDPSPPTYSPPTVPSSPPPTTPSYSPPPVPAVDPVPPTYSPPVLPSSPPPSTPSYSPPPPTPYVPTTPPSSPSPKPPTPSPPTQTPPSPSPKPPTPSPSPTPVTPSPTPPTPTPSPATPAPTPTPTSPATPAPSPPTPTPTTPWTPPTPTSPSPSPPSTPTPTPTPPSPTTPTPSSPYPWPSPPTTPSTPSTPPSSGVAARKRVRCRNKGYGGCYGQEFTCPANCPTSCQVDCNSCKPVCSCDYPGAVCQDPRFIGGDGITFYFHGKKDRDFCLVSDPNLHINAHFIGKRNPEMTRDFTWVQSIGILFDNRRLFIGAKPTATWNPAVDRLSLALDNIPIALPETTHFQWRSTTTSRQITITRTSDSNDVLIEVEGKMTITAKVVPITEEESRVHNYAITKDDCFAHLNLGFKFSSLSKGVDGVLGKTYRDDYVSKVKMGVAMPVVGGDKEYSTSNLFATDCLVSRFNNNVDQEWGALQSLELGSSSMNCGSGMNGEGVVCKR